MTWTESARWDTGYSVITMRVAVVAGRPVCVSVTGSTTPGDSHAAVNVALEVNGFAPLPCQRHPTCVFGVTWKAGEADGEEVACLDATASDAAVC